MLVIQPISERCMEKQITLGQFLTSKMIELELIPDDPNQKGSFVLSEGAGIGRGTATKLVNYDKSKSDSYLSIRTLKLVAKFLKVDVEYLRYLAGQRDDPPSALSAKQVSNVGVMAELLGEFKEDDIADLLELWRRYKAGKIKLD